MTHVAKTTDRPAGPAAGFSLIEVLVSSSLLILMVYVVTTLTISGNDAQKYSERMSRVTEIGQSLIDEMRSELTSSVKIFHDDPVGNGMLSLIDLRQSPRRIGSRLPVLDATGIFGPDTDTVQRTGNTVLFARHAWHTRFLTSTSKTYRVDVFRIVHYYMTPEDGGPQNGRPIGLNLVKWVGEPVADGEQIDSISDANDREEVLGHLRNSTPDIDNVEHPEVQVVWRRDALPTDTGALRFIRNNGTMRNSAPSSRGSVWRVQTENPPAGLLYYRHHSIATNFAPSNFRISQFGKKSSTGDGFPHGFEVQTIGPASARQMMLRVTLTSTNRRGHRAFTTLQGIMDARDL